MHCEKPAFLEEIWRKVTKKHWYFLAASKILKNINANSFQISIKILFLHLTKLKMNGNV
jgi:hypothetical protein